MDENNSVWQMLYIEFAFYDDTVTPGCAFEYNAKMGGGSHVCKGVFLYTLGHVHVNIYKDCFEFVHTCSHVVYTQRVVICNPQS